MWPSVSNSSNGNEGGIKGYNLILLDDEVRLNILPLCCVLMTFCYFMDIAFNICLIIDCVIIINTLTYSIFMSPWLNIQDSHVHAFVYADNWKFHADKIVEGGVFIFSNFYAKEALGSLKPVSSSFRINFSPSTNVERVADDFMIARHKFEFVDLSDFFGFASEFANRDLPEYSTGYFYRNLYILLHWYWNILILFFIIVFY